MKNKIYYIAAVHNWENNSAAYRHITEVCKEFTNLGYSVELLLPKPAKNKIIQSQSFKIRFIPVLRAHHLLLSISFQLSLIPVLSQKIKNEKNAVFYARFNLMDFIKLLPLRLFFKFNYISEINGIPSLETPKGSAGQKITAFFENLSIRLNDRIITVTEELRHWVTKINPALQKNSLTVSNGVDVNFFCPKNEVDAKKESGLNPNEIYLNYTSNLYPWHGSMELLETFKYITDKLKNVTLLIIGNGPELNRLKNRAVELGIADKIYWAGRVSPNQVVNYINASIVCLAPVSMDAVSSIGRSSLKVFEYMACAKPFITTRIGKNYDMLVKESGAGVLVETGRPQAFAESVLDLLNNPDRAIKMGKMGRETVVSHYSWRRTSEKILNFIFDEAKTIEKPISGDQ